MERRCIKAILENGNSEPASLSNLQQKKQLSATDMQNALNKLADTGIVTTYETKYTNTKSTFMYDKIKIKDLPLEDQHKYLAILDQYGVEPYIYHGSFALPPAYRADRKHQTHSVAAHGAGPSTVVGDGATSVIPASAPAPGNSLAGPSNSAAPSNAPAHSTDTSTIPAMYAATIPPPTAPTSGQSTHGYAGLFDRRPSRRVPPVISPVPEEPQSGAASAQGKPFGYSFLCVFHLCIWTLYPCPLFPRSLCLSLTLSHSFVSITPRASS